MQHQVNNQITMNNLTILHINITRLNETTPIPSYHSNNASGLDLHANIDSPIHLPPLERKLVPTGIQLEIPPGFEGQVRPRSGLANQFGITVLNSPGTIDSDYRGEIKVLLINLGNDPFIINPLMRIAQLVFSPICKSTLCEIQQLSKTQRGADGYGSTGLYTAHPPLSGIPEK